jgi:hypothetical protein
VQTHLQLHNTKTVRDRQDHTYKKKYRQLTAGVKTMNVWIHHDAEVLDQEIKTVAAKLQ